MKIASILFFSTLTFMPVFTAEECQCLCSLFFTRGGEKKLCSEISTTKTKCVNWYHDVPGVSNRQKCLTLGESINECKGNYFENSRKADWTPIEGGRYHSCRFNRAKD